MALNNPHFLIVMPFCNPFPLSVSWTRWLASNEKTAKVEEHRFRSRLQKDCGSCLGTHICSLLDHFLWVKSAVVLWGNMWRRPEWQGIKACQQPHEWIWSKLLLFPPSAPTPWTLQMRLQPIGILARLQPHEKPGAESTQPRCDPIPDVRKRLLFNCFISICLC